MADVGGYRDIGPGQEEMVFSSGVLEVGSKGVAVGFAVGMK